MKNKKQFILISIFFLSSFTSYTYPQTQCDSLIDFDSMPLVTFGQNINSPGDTIFTISNIVVTIDSMSWIGGGKGYYQALIDISNCGFGYGRTVRLNNVSLIFDLNLHNPNTVSFIFMDLGGDENLQVNSGNLYIVNSFRSLPTTVAPGITCTVDSIKADNCGAGGLIGRVTLSGNVNELLIAGQELWIDSLCIDIVSSSLPDHSFLNQPQKYIVEQNYPNPFNPKTTIKYKLPKSQKVKIDIFNLLGQKIETLLSKQMPAGSYEVEFTANDLPSGIYFYKIEAGEYQETKKMILLK